MSFFDGLVWLELRSAGPTNFLCVLWCVSGKEKKNYSILPNYQDQWSTHVPQDDKLK